MEYDEGAVAADRSPEPVRDRERITSLDTLRGFALLGILLMNIVEFSMHIGAYDNPTVTGGPAAGLNLGVWAVLHVLAEGKMRALFSLVFGASMLLLTSRLEASGKAADIWYRRSFWLIPIGVAHAYLLWQGDILYPYAICGLLLYPFRNMPPRGLLMAGAAFLLYASAWHMATSVETRNTIEKGRAAMASEASGEKLNEAQREEKREYEDWMAFNRPTAAQLATDARQWRGSAADVIAARARLLAQGHYIPYYHGWNADVWCMMLIGMGLFKQGVLSGGLPARRYLFMALAGYGVGLPLNIWSAWEIVRSGFDPVVQTLYATTYDAGRLSVALGHLSIILLLCRSGALQWLTLRLSAAGQMALSNYVVHSVICSFIFTGYGLGLYGTLQRWQVYSVVLGIWAAQLAYSPVWLRHFRFGPVEWGWRSLTYWKRQPFRRLHPVTGTATASAGP